MSSWGLSSAESSMNTRLKGFGWSLIIFLFQSIVFSFLFGGVVLWGQGVGGWGGGICLLVSEVQADLEGSGSDEAAPPSPRQGHHEAGVAENRLSAQPGHGGASIKQVMLCFCTPAESPRELGYCGRGPCPEGTGKTGGEPRRHHRRPGHRCRGRGHVPAALQSRFPPLPLRLPCLLLKGAAWV